MSFSFVAPTLVGVGLFQGPPIDPPPIAWSGVLLSWREEKQLVGKLSGYLTFASAIVHLQLGRSSAVPAVLFYDISRIGRTTHSPSLVCRGAAGFQLKEERRRGLYTE